FPPLAYSPSRASSVLPPASGRLAAGVPLRDLGRPAAIKTPLRFHLQGREGEVVRIDRYGNIITNLPHIGKDSYLVVEQGYWRTMPFVRAYAEAPPGQLYVTEGSAGTLEIALRNHSAWDVLDVPLGSRIIIE